MCTAPFLDLICNAGVDSLKIEGRAKTFYYVASVTAAYRRALDHPLDFPRFFYINIHRIDLPAGQLLPHPGGELFPRRRAEHGDAVPTRRPLPVRRGVPGR